MGRVRLKSLQIKMRLHEIMIHEVDFSPMGFERDPNLGQIVPQAAQVSVDRVFFLRCLAHVRQIHEVEFDDVIQARPVPGRHVEIIGLGQLDLDRQVRPAVLLEVLPAVGQQAVQVGRVEAPFCHGYLQRRAPVYRQHGAQRSAGFHLPVSQAHPGIDQAHGIVQQWSGGFDFIQHIENSTRGYFRTGLQSNLRRDRPMAPVWQPTAARCRVRDPVDAPEIVLARGALQVREDILQANDFLDGFIKRLVDQAELNFGQDADRAQRCDYRAKAWFGVI